MAQRGRRFTLPIWAHLAGFALAVMLPLWALVLYIGLSSLERERAEYQNQTMLVARSFAVDLDHELSGFKSILSVLATSPALADGNLRRFSEQALRVAPEGGAIVLRDRSGAQIVNTLFPFGTKLPERTSETVTATDRCVFETRAVCTSDLYTGVSDKQPYVLVDAPVMRDGEIAYFLNVGVPATNLAALLRAHQTPPGWAISIIDRQDRLIARSPDHDRYVGSLANQSLRESAKDAEGTVRAVNVAGIPVWGAYVRLPTWGWRVAIGVPEAVLNTPLRRSMAYLGGLVLGATALSLAAVIIYGRRLAGAIALLSRLATRIVEPVLLGPIETSVREVNEVSCSIAEASRRLAASIAERDRADAAMRRWNEELEARVAAEIAAREDAQARVLQAQRIQALGQLAGGIAHDFNNVLQAANGCAAAIIKRAGDPDAVRRFAELLLGAVDRGSSVTRRLLGFAK
ncbi:MAG: hypothetical protein RQ966_12025 [Acetobacteraceae bacterium]|nr:hypothetical protein [Acetobacteraceae bacterium]